MQHSRIDALDDAAVRLHLDRVLHSKSFEGAEVHRRLLQYLAERALAGDTDQLKEYTIAIDALGKASTYDPRHESVVRIQVGRLRNKLAEYYQAEGAQEPIRISLPKGGFKVFFEEPPNDRADGSVSAKWRLASLLLAVTLVLAAGYGFYTTLRLNSALREAAPSVEAWSPELQDFWAPFLDSKRHLAIYFGTPQPMQWYSFTGIGEASGGFLLEKLLGTRRSDISVTRSNLLSWQEISDTDVIFLGPPKFNSQLRDIPVKQEIVIEATGLRVMTPGPNEPAFYQDSFPDGPEFNGATHALISCTPGPSGNGELLILAGNASPGTMAASQWLTQPRLVKELASHMRLSTGKLPKYYQILLRVEFKNGVPVRSAYVLHRVLQAK